MKAILSYIFFVLSAFVFFNPLCAADVYGLSLLDSYAQRGSLKIWGDEFPISVYVKKNSDGSRAMAIDGGAGVLIKAKFDRAANISEIVVSDIFGGRKEAAANIAAEIFWGCLGYLDKIQSAEIRSKSVDTMPQFVQTDSLKIEFSDYVKFKNLHLPKKISATAGFMTIQLFLAN